VRQTKNLDDLRQTIGTLENTLLILDQKKLRIDGELYRNDGNGSTSHLYSNAI